MRTHFFSPLTLAFLPVVLTLSLAFAPALPCDAQTTAAVLHESQPKGAVNDEGTPSTPPAGAAAATPDPTISPALAKQLAAMQDRKSTRLNSSHVRISYAVFCL